MDVMQFLFLALLFLAVFGLVYFALSQFLANPVRDRLEVIAGGGALRPERPPSQWVQRIVKLTGPLAKLSVPDEGWESSSVRTHFMNAGFRNPSAPPPRQAQQDKGQHHARGLAQQREEEGQQGKPVIAGEP